MHAVREHLPRLASAMEAAERTDPFLARQMWMRWAPRVREAMALHQREPDMFKVKLDELRAGIDVLEASRHARELMGSRHDPEPDISAKRDAAKAALREALRHGFDARVAVQEQEIKALSARVEDIKKRLEKQRSERDTRIDEIATRILEGKGPGPGGMGDDEPPPGRPGPGGPR